MSPCLQRKPAALALDTRPAPAAEGELGMRGDEWGDALSVVDAQRCAAQEVLHGEDDELARRVGHRIVVRDMCLRARRVARG